MPAEFDLLFGTTQQTTPGQVLTFQFDTSNVNRNRQALLLFNARAVSTNQTVQINGIAVGNGIQPSPSDVAFASHVSTIGPNVLREENNVMEIFATEEFLIDNCFIFWRTS